MNIIADDNVTNDNLPQHNLPKDNVPGVNDNSAKQNEDLSRIKQPGNDDVGQTGDNDPEIIRRGNRGQ